jgi:fused signal recognition particle receptor
MGIFSKFIAKIKGENAFAPSDWQDLERELLASDIGPTLTQSLLDSAHKVKSENAQEALKATLTSYLSTQSRAPITNPEGMTVVMVVGVNGTGKTTSVAKLASNIKSSGSAVVVAAGDTFRAAAVEQLQTWGSRIDVEVVSGKPNGDPASVAFDAVKRAAQSQAQYLIIDTAGRLHNKSDLMAELEKVKRVVEKVAPVSEVLLTIDATTGQNGMAQAKLFAESVSVTGIILTKLDGSARGGIALAIESELNIPIKWVGTGESEADFAVFNASEYIEGLLA